MKFKWVKKDSPSSKSLSKTKYVAKSGGQIIVQQEITLSQAKDIINDLVEQKLVAVKREAEETYKNRICDFEKEIFNRLEELKPDELNKLREPDLQIALSEATVISGRRQEKELRDTLANLVIGRIKNCEEGREELKNIVYNEAIQTIGKLTIDQLKIITLCYLLRYTQYNPIISWESFNNYLNTIISPFLVFKETNAEYQHIQYTGCGIIGQLVSINLINIFKTHYSFLFLKFVEESEIKDLDIPDQFKYIVLRKDYKENKYYFQFRNIKSMKEWLDTNIDDINLRNKIDRSFTNHIKSAAEIEKNIIEKTELGEQLIDFCKKSAIMSLALSSVGIVIGATYFEQITGEKINIDIWIN